MKTEKHVLCAVRDTYRFVTEVLCTIGMPPKDADFMGSMIVASDLAGHESHGLRRLSEYVAACKQGFVNPTPSVVLDLDRGATVRLNGDDGFGHIVVRDATDLAIGRAQQFGIAAVAVRQCSHAGRYADFCHRAAERGAAIIFFVNDGGAGQDVAPPGATEPRLATNPIAAGIPRRTPPHLVLDMSTSVVAAGRLAEERDRGESIPAEWTTDTGALRTAGGVKGFGLALVVEALAGALSGAGTVGAATGGDHGQGVFIVAIDISRFRSPQDFTSEVDSFLNYVRDVPLEHGASAIRVPGEGGASMTAQRTLSGVPVQPFTWDRTRLLAGELGIAAPRLESNA